jgi:hypothetical protein
MSGYLAPDRFETLAHNGTRQAPVVLRWENQGYDFTVPADGPWGQVASAGGDCFGALVKVREQIEPARWFLGVNGVRRDTWPSDPCRGMGGFLVCPLTPGVLPAQADLIQTFHEAPRDTLATVTEQMLFEQQWRHSLSPPPARH